MGPVRPRPGLDQRRRLAPLRPDFALVDLAPEARAAGVTATVLVQTITVPGETPEFLALADSALAAGVVGWTDLTAPDIADTLARLRACPGGEHLVGIQVIQWSAHTGPSSSGT